MDFTPWVIAGVTFIAVFLLARAALNPRGNVDVRLRTRLAAVRAEADGGEKAELLIREKYLRRLSPLERRLEELPGMAWLERRIEQSGRSAPAYRLVLSCFAAALAAAMLAAVLSRNAALPLVAGLVAFPFPFLRMESRRRERISQFERDLPGALNLMSRALQAGSPFMDAFKFVGEEMHGPIGEEFRLTWSHINYGVSMKASMADFVERMPSISLRALVTSVLVQRETGGNLADILDKIAEVLRTRFRFERRLRTLTAEGRMSAWVLISLPFALFGVLSLTSPTYISALTTEPAGHKALGIGLALMTVGVVWIRRTIRVRI